MIASPAWNCSTKTGTPNSPKATVCSTRSSTAAGQATTTEHPTAPCACCTRPSRPTPRPSTTGPSPRSSTPAASNMVRCKMPCARSPIQACGRWRTTATTGKPSATTSPWPRNCAPIRKPANTYTRPMRTDWPIRPSRNGTDVTIHGTRKTFKPLDEVVDMEAGTVEGQARHVDARPSGRTGRHGPAQEPAKATRTARTVDASPTHP